MYKLFIGRHFKKQLKPYAKKYKGLSSAILKNLISFQKENVIHLGKRLYKLRVSTSDYKKGKSKSLRLIAFIEEDMKLLCSITIYSKDKFSNLSKKILMNHLDRVISEINSLKTSQKPLK